MATNTLKIGDHVLSDPYCDYPLLLGTITEINLLSSEAHDTENDTDDIVISFIDEGYSQARSDVLTEHFRELYDDPDKQLADIPLDMVIMAPDELTVVPQDEYMTYYERILANESFAETLYYRLKSENHKC